MRNLEFGALFHDVGKMAIPNDIINKPGELDRTSGRDQTHDRRPAPLDRVGGFMSDVGLIVRAHHERWDGQRLPGRCRRRGHPARGSTHHRGMRQLERDDHLPQLPRRADPGVARDELIAVRTELDSRIVDILLKIVSGDVSIAGAEPVGRGGLAMVLKAADSTVPW